MSPSRLTIQKIDLTQIPPLGSITFLHAELSATATSSIVVVYYADQGKPQPLGLRLDLDKKVFLDHLDDVLKDRDVSLEAATVASTVSEKMSEAIIGHTGSFDLFWIEDEAANGTPVGRLDGAIQIETGPLKSWTVVGHANEKFASFCMHWFTGKSEARQLQITDVESGKMWRGKFFLGHGSLSLVGKGNNKVMLVSTGEVKEHNAIS